MWAQRGNDAWQNKDVVDWNAAVRHVPGSLVMKAVMHHRHELELRLFRQANEGRHASAASDRDPHVKIGDNNSIA